MTNSLRTIVQRKVEQMHNETQYSSLIMRPIAALVFTVLNAITLLTLGMWIGISAMMLYFVLQSETALMFFTNSMMFIVAFFGLGNILYMNFDELFAEISDS